MLRAPVLAPHLDDFQRSAHTLRTAPFNEGIFRLSEKPDVRGKTFASFGWGGHPSFAKGGRPRGRKTKYTRAPKLRWNTQANAAILQHQSKRKRRPYRRVAGMARLCLIGPCTAQPSP